MIICVDWLMCGKKPSGLPIRRAGTAVEMQTVQTIARLLGKTFLRKLIWFSGPMVGCPEGCMACTQSHKINHKAH
jgi:hypothetical protein